MSEVVIEGSTFRVWQNGTKAQAIRTNTQWAPSSMAIRPRFIEAIEQATGCKVTSAKGDAAIVTASLDCD